jgi:hypothetical protein
MTQRQTVVIQSSSEDNITATKRVCHCCEGGYPQLNASLDGMRSVIFEAKFKSSESQALYGEVTNEEIRLTGGVCPSERRSPGLLLALRLRAYETQGLDRLDEMPFRHWHKQCPTTHADFRMKGGLGSMTRET